MTGDCHVRICGGLGVRFPRATRPKWMFRNVTAIRENTERILQLLESERPASAQPVSTPPPPEQIH